MDKIRLLPRNAISHQVSISEMDRIFEDSGIWKQSWKPEHYLVEVGSDGHTTLCSDMFFNPEQDQPCILSREVKEYFEQVSSQWDTMRQGFYGEEVREAVLMAARILPDQTVLDVGAGTGFLTEAASRKARKVIALEIPLPDASVDAVIGNMVLHHCPRPETAVKEMTRVLEPKGRLVLSDLQEHNHDSLRKEHADLWMGFKMSYVSGIMHEAGLEDVSVESLSSCCSETREDGQIKIPMFLAAGHKHW
ncbi:methyltransferase domain-containing protein [Candidatus Bathyarchaeota archaeon]|nr:MAG: methyltransferase domain-containing protein [Candidatus Bathyarchaeota archaeon]